MKTSTPMAKSKSAPTSEGAPTPAPEIEREADPVPNGHDSGPGPTSEAKSEPKPKPADEPANDDPVDPFDIESLRAGGAHEDFGAEEVMLSLDVRRPGPKEYFRVHPDPKYRLDVPLIPHETGLDRSFYWVPPHLRAVLAEHLVVYRIYVCSSKRQATFLWAARLPLAGSSGRKWHELAHRCAHEAMRDWGKIKGDHAAGGYSWLLAKTKHPDPVWTDKPMEELIKLAFADYIIDTLDHLVIKSLEGEII